MKSVSPILIVRNLITTMEFYKENLGFNLENTFPQDCEPNEPNFASLKSGDVKFMFMSVKCLDDYPDPQFVEQILTSQLGVGVNLFLEVDDFGDLYEKIKGKGVKILFGPTTMPWGVREFSIKDPDGYQLTFGQRDNLSNIQSKDA